MKGDRERKRPRKKQRDTHTKREKKERAHYTSSITKGKHFGESKNHCKQKLKQRD